jgi:hypothetical protein
MKRAPEAMTWGGGRFRALVALVALVACGAPATVAHAPPAPPAAAPPPPPSPMGRRAAAACAELRALTARKPPPAPDESGGFGGPGRVAHATDACGVADDALEKLEDTIAGEGVVSDAAAPSPSWDRAVVPAYLDRVDARFALSPAERAALRADGFVVPERLSAPSYGHAMAEIFRSELPLFVSADALLGAVYAGNDSVVASVEQQRLQPAMAVLLAKLACALPEAAAGWPPEVGRDIDVYVGVARALADASAASDEAPETTDVADTATDVRSITRDLVQAEGLLGAPGAPPFVLFGRSRVVDASLFRPRGHYAAMGLEGYFRAATWLSRLELNVKSRSSRSSHPGVAPDPSETPREDLDALALAELVERAHASEELAILDAGWTLLAGPREDISLPEIARLRRQAGIASLRDADAAERLRDAVGDGWPRTARTHFMPQGTTELPAITTALGPRVGVDATATRSLVDDAVPGRSMLHAADIAYVLGNDRAKAYLADDLKRWPMLAGALDAAREQAAMAPPREDLFGSWLEAIRGLAELPAPAAPSFMRTDAWRDLRLGTTVAAFGELRHNAVLMSAGTYDAFGCAIPDGWVEPIPATLDALIAYADRGLHAMDVLDPSHATEADAYFARLRRVLSVLRRIVATEIAGHALSDAERRFLGSVAEIIPQSTACVDSCAPPTYTGWWFDMFLRRIADGTASPEFVADYYASTQAGAVAYIGAREPRFGVFVVDAGGGPRAMVGPVAYAFEATGPLEQRFADADVPDIKGTAAPWMRAYATPSPPEPFHRFLRVARRDSPPPLELEVTSDRALGAVTLDLLDHHRRVVASVTHAAGPGPTRFRFDDPRAAEAEGVRLRAGAYVLSSPDGFDVSVERSANAAP